VKARTIVFTLTLCFVGAFCCAQNVNMGTWKLNEAKSKISHGAPKNTMVVYEAAGENVRVVIDGIGSDGRPMHSEWTGKFDSKDYSVIGDPNSDARSLTKIDDRTLGFNAKKNGKTILSGRIVVSADGKSRTVTSSGADSNGKTISSLAVYDKQ
jgi:hypothetical protein